MTPIETAMIAIIPLILIGKLWPVSEYQTWKAHERWLESKAIPQPDEGWPQLDGEIVDGELVE